MKVYHGSYLKIHTIDLSKCEPHKDFGRGFYVTKFLEQAEIWANRKGKSKHTKGVITEFTFFEYAFSDKNFNTLRFDAYNDEWLDFVVVNRHLSTPQPSHSYDIVEGPVADDKITARIDAYVRGEISRKEFLQELSFEKPSHQLCFCTVKSLLMLERVDFRGITAIERISEAVVANLVANDDLSEAQATDFFYNSQTYTILSDVNSGYFEKPWQEIYELLKKEL
jgi:hypothetical protein